MFNRNLVFSVVDYFFICVKIIWDIWEIFYFWNICCIYMYYILKIYMRLLKIVIGIC